MRLSVVKLLSAKWIIIAVEEVTSCEIKKHMRELEFYNMFTLNFANCSDHCTELSKLLYFHIIYLFLAANIFPSNLTTPLKEYPILYIIQWNFIILASQCFSNHS